MYDVSVGEKKTPASFKNILSPTGAEYNREAYPSPSSTSTYQPGMILVCNRRRFVVIVTIAAGRRHLVYVLLYTVYRVWRFFFFFYRCFRSTFIEFGIIFLNRFAFYSETIVNISTVGPMVDWTYTPERCSSNFGEILTLQNVSLRTRH